MMLPPLHLDLYSHRQDCLSLLIIYYRHSTRHQHGARSDGAQL